MEPTIDTLLDAPAAHGPRIRAALLVALPGDPAAILEVALKRLEAWHHEVEIVGESIESMVRQIDATTQRFVRASVVALSEEGPDGLEQGPMLSQAMELAWLAGGSAGDVPAVAGERLRQTLLDAQRALDSAGDVVRRFRHGADHARVLARPAVIEPAVRDAARLLLATRRAGRVRKVIAEATRRGWMRMIVEGSQRELLLTALVLVETGEVTDRELAERFARQGLMRDRQLNPTPTGPVGASAPAMSPGQSPPAEAGGSAGTALSSTSAS
jgi:hypothetical protein